MTVIEQTMTYQQRAFSAFKISKMSPQWELWELCLSGNLTEAMRSWGQNGEREVELNKENLEAVELFERESEAKEKKLEKESEEKEEKRRS